MGSSTNVIATVDDLATVVRDLRKSQDLTQAELADRAHVSRQFVIDIEAGHPRAEFGKVLDLMHALGRPGLTAAESIQAIAVRSKESALPKGVDTAENLFVGLAVPNMVRRDRKFFLSLALHNAIRERLMSEPDRVLEHGLHGVQLRLRNADGSARDLVNEWLRLISKKELSTLNQVMVGTDEHSVEMRNVTPFIDVLPDEDREAVVASVLAERAWAE